MGIASSSPEVVGWLTELSAERRAAVDNLRQVIREAAPSVHEIVYHGALGYGTSTSGFDRILYVSLSSKHLTLGFFFGTALDDPDHLLQGTGKRMRHIKIRRPDDTRNPAVQQLVRQALHDGAPHVERLHKR